MTIQNYSDHELIEKCINEVNCFIDIEISVVVQEDTFEVKIVSKSEEDPLI